MPTAVWPAQLRQNYVLGYTEERPDERIRFAVDAGPAKMRRRFSNSSRLLRCTDKLTAAQRDLLDSFYRDTLNGGVDEFERVDPHDLTVQRFRFLSPPKYTGMSNQGGRWYEVTIELELVPS